MAINSRNKGANGEREIIRILEDELGVRLERNLAQSFAGGHDLLGLDEWALEIKRYRQVGIPEKRAFWVQAVEQANRVGKRPAVIFREDRKPWRVLVQIETECFEQISFHSTAEISLELFISLIRESLNGSVKDHKGRDNETAEGARVWPSRSR